jgi:hypothetical protein
MKKLLPFVLLPVLTACGSAFEAGDLFPDAGDAGSTTEASGRVDAGHPDSGQSLEAATPDAEAGAPDVGIVQEAASDAQDASQDAPDVDAATEAAPTCSAPRCVNATTVQPCVSGSWGPTTSCPYVCLSGACSGVCVPGATMSCSECANFGTQTCLPDGTWGQCSASC